MDIYKMILLYFVHLVNGFLKNSDTLHKKNLHIDDFVGFLTNAKRAKWGNHKKIVNIEKNSRSPLEKNGGMVYNRV